MKLFTIIKQTSERLPGKNFLPLGGKPLWRHTIDTFENFEVFINTDSTALINEVREMNRPGLVAFERSKAHIDWELQSETLGSPVNAILAEFLRDWVDDPEEICVLFHVTSPFVRAETVLRASSKLAEGFESVQAVEQFQDFVWEFRDGSSTPLNFEPKKVSRTQDLAPLYLSRGAFFIMTKRGFLRDNSRDVEPRYLYPLDRIEAVEIDTEDDFILAQTIVGDYGIN